MHIINSMLIMHRILINILKTGFQANIDLSLIIRYSSRPTLQKMRAVLRDSKIFEDNLRVGLMRHKKYTACEWILSSCKCSRVTSVVHFSTTTRE